VGGGWVGGWMCVGAWVCLCASTRPVGCWLQAGGPRQSAWGDGELVSRTTSSPALVLHCPVTRAHPALLVPPPAPTHPYTLHIYPNPPTHLLAHTYSPTHTHKHNTQPHTHTHTHAQHTHAPVLRAGMEKVVRLFDVARPEAAPEVLPIQPSGIRCLTWVQEDSLLLCSLADHSGIMWVGPRVCVHVFRLCGALLCGSHECCTPPGGHPFPGLALRLPLPRSSHSHPLLTAAPTASPPPRW